MVFEQVHLFAADIRLLERLLNRALCGGKLEQVGTVVQGQRIRHTGRCGDTDQWMGKVFRQQFAAGQDERSGTVCIGGNIIQIERVTDRFGFLVSFQCDGFTVHGVLVAGCVGVSSQREARQPVGGHIELVHVTAHQQRRLGGGRQTLNGLEVAIGHRGNGGFHLRADHIGEFLHTDHERHIHETAGNGQIALTQGRAA